MSSDQNTAGVPRPVEELSAGEKLERADGPSDQGSELTWPSHQGKWRASISKPARSRRRARAVERDLTNVQFQVGNIYELPFAADSFDGVFAHTVLQHLSDPLRALGEMRRVLRPHGIIGLRDDDLGTLLVEPSTPLLRLWESLHIKV